MMSVVLQPTFEQVDTTDIFNEWMNYLTIKGEANLSYDAFVNAYKPRGITG